MIRRRRKKAILSAKFFTDSDESNTVTIPGEPMLYSAIYNVEDGIKRLKNSPEKPLIKAIIQKMPKWNVPVVLHVIFYVRPPPSLKLEPKEYRDETVPATACHELIDYLFYVLNLLNRTVIESYKQVVKVNMEKFYSMQPRTYLRFLTWSDYLELHREDTIYAEAKNKCCDNETRSV